MKNIISVACKTTKRKGFSSTCASSLDRFYVLETFVCRTRADASRSDGRVLHRFLPVRFESCLNDTPRFTSVQRVEAMEYFKGAFSGSYERRAARAAGLFKETIIKVALIKRVVA